MAGSLENRGKLRELIDKFKFDEVNVMNELVFRNLSEDAKRQICAWKYGVIERIHQFGVAGLVSLGSTPIAL